MTRAPSLGDDNVSFFPLATVRGQSPANEAMNCTLGREPKELAMAISFACRQCGRKLKVDEKFAGKSGRCPQCGASTRVPDPSPGVGPPSSLEILPDDVYGLEDAAPVLPPRASQPSFEAPVKNPKPAAAKAKKSKSATSGKAKQASGVGSLIVVALIVLRVVLRLNRGNAGHNDQQPAFPAAPAAVVASAPADPPAFSARGEGNVIRPGVRFFQVKASGSPNVATLNMTIWVYLPDQPHDSGSLPCVVVAPAGSTVFTGMDLGDGDRAEHFPYVPAGYAVLSYSIDGYLENPQQAGDAKLAQAAGHFIAARAGLANAKTAIDWMLKNFPEVDPERLYAAGHSSAGTMALLLAENDPRLKACAAFAPRSNTEANLTPDQLPILRRVISGANQVFTTFNPAKHVGEIKCPVLLFHARDDSVVPVRETEAFAASLRSAGKEVTVELVDSGNHYDPMVSQGIPRAIQFFAEHGSRAQGAAP